MAKKDSADFLTFFEKNPFPSWICKSRSVEVTAVNRAAVKAFGYSRQKLLKMPVNDFLSGEESLAPSRKEFSKVTFRLACGELLPLPLFIQSFSKQGKRYDLYTVGHDARQVTAEAQKKKSAGDLLVEFKQSATDRHVYEKLLGRINEQLRETLLFAHLGSALLNLRTFEITIGVEFLKILEVESADPIVMPFERFVNTFVMERDHEKAMNLLQEGLSLGHRNRKELSIELFMRTRQGEVRLCTGRSVFRKEYAYAVFQDITDIRAREQMQRQQSRLIQSMLSSIPDGFVAIDKDWKFTIVNHSLAAILGKKQETLIGKKIWEELPHTITKEMYKPCHEALQQGQSKHFEINSMDVQGRCLDVHAYPNSEGLFVYFTDISEKKRAEEEVLLKTRQLEIILSGLKNYFLIVDKNWKIVMTNEGFANLVQLKSQELVGRSIWDIFPLSKGTELEAQCRRAMQKREPTMVNYASRRVPGRYYHINMFPYHDGMLSIFEDATEKKRISSEIQRLALVAEHTKHAVLFTDIQGNITWVNQGFTKITEYTANEVLDKKIDLLYGEETAGYTKKSIEQSFVTKEGIQTELLSYTRSGSAVWVDLEVIPVRDEEDIMTGFMIMAADITRLKTAVHEMLKSRDQLQTIMDYAPADVFVKDMHGRYLFFNKSFKNHFVQDSQLVIVTEHELFEKGKANEFVMSDHKVLETGKSITLEQEVFIDDKLEHFLTIKFPMLNDRNEVYAIGGVALQITEMKKMQQQLKNNEAYLQRILHTMINGVVVVDHQGKITYINEGALRILELEAGIDPSSCAEFPDMKLVDENGKDLPEDQIPLLIALNLKEKVTNRELGLIVARGELKWLSVSATPILDNNQRVVGAVASFLDISERKRAEAQLKETSSRLSLATSSAGIGIWDWDIKRDVLIWDEKMYELFGVPAGKDGPDYWRERVHPSDRNEVMESLSFAITHGGVFDSEYRIVCDNGEFRHIRDYGVVQRKSGGEPVSMTGICWDITQQKMFEQSLSESEHQLRLNVREKEILIKEIHHRVKNNLQLISSIIYLKVLSLDESEFKSFLENTRHRIKSIALIHERLLQSERLNQVDISDYLGNLLKDIEVAQHRQDVNISMEPDIEHIVMPIDIAIHCGLIVNEVVTNSMKHAFKGRSEGTVRVCFARENNRYVLRIADNGISLPEDIVPGKTDSFGMQMLDVFVKQLNGNVRILRGSGTTFEVCF